MSHTELSIYTDNLIQSLRARYPELSSQEVEIAANTIIKEVSRHLAEGGDIALLRRNSDRTVDLTLIELKVINRLKRR